MAGAGWEAGRLAEGWRQGGEALLAVRALLRSETRTSTPERARERASESERERGREKEREREREGVAGDLAWPRGHPLLAAHRPRVKR